MKAKKIGTLVFIAIFVAGVTWILVSYFGTSKKIYEGTLVRQTTPQQIEQRLKI